MKRLEAGVKYNRFTILSRAGIPSGIEEVRAYWNVKCDCGKKRVMANRAIRQNQYCSTDCGCKASNSFIRRRK